MVPGGPGSPSAPGRPGRPGGPCGQRGRESWVRVHRDGAGPGDTRGQEPQCSWKHTRQVPTLQDAGAWNIPEPKPRGGGTSLWTGWGRLLGHGHEQEVVWGAQREARGRVGAAACTTPRKAVYSQARFTPQPFHQRRLPTSPSRPGWSMWREVQLPPPGARLPLAALQLNTWALVPGLCADDSDSDAGAGAPSDAAGGDPRLIPDAPQRRPGTGVLLPGQSRRCGPIWARTNAFLASRCFLSQKPCPSSRHTDLREVESEGPSPCPGVPGAQL